MTDKPDIQAAQGPYRMPAELAHALEILSIGMGNEGVRSYPGGGGLWFGKNREFADATFVDWGLARAVATILTEAHSTARLLAASWDLLACAQKLLEHLQFNTGVPAYLVTAFEATVAKAQGREIPRPAIVARDWLSQEEADQATVEANTALGWKEG